MRRVPHFCQRKNKFSSKQYCYYKEEIGVSRLGRIPLSCVTVQLVPLSFRKVHSGFCVRFLSLLPSLPPPSPVGMSYRWTIQEIRFGAGIKRTMRKDTVSWERERDGDSIVQVYGCTGVHVHWFLVFSGIRCTWNFFIGREKNIRRFCFHWEIFSLSLVLLFSSRVFPFLYLLNGYAFLQLLCPFFRGLCLPCPRCVCQKNLSSFFLKLFPGSFCNKLSSTTPREVPTDSLSLALSWSRWGIWNISPSFVHWGMISWWKPEFHENFTL